MGGGGGGGGTWLKTQVGIPKDCQAPGEMQSCEKKIDTLNILQEKKHSQVGETKETKNLNYTGRGMFRHHVSPPLPSYTDLFPRLVTSKS